MTDQNPIVEPQLQVGDIAIDQDSKNLAVICHLLTIFFSFIPGLLFYLLKPDDSFVKEHAKEALNMSINFIIYYVIATLLMVVLIGFLLFPVLWIASVVILILAALKAKDGEHYRIPLLMVRLIK